MKTASLPPLSLRIALGQTVLPIGNPPVNRDSSLKGCAEEMNVIRHQQTIANLPGSRIVLPNPVKRLMAAGII